MFVNRDLWPELPVGGVLHHAVYGLQKINHGQVLQTNGRYLFFSIPPYSAAAVQLVKKLLYCYSLYLLLWINKLIYVFLQRREHIA